jgi:hypothetical protein
VKLFSWLANATICMIFWPNSKMRQKPLTARWAEVQGLPTQLSKMNLLLLQTTIQDVVFSQKRRRRRKWWGESPIELP